MESYRPILYNALQGKYDEAEPLNRRSLAIMEQTQGSEHAVVLAASIDLALTLQAQVMLKRGSKIPCINDNVLYMMS